METCPGCTCGPECDVQEFAGPDGHWWFELYDGFWVCEFCEKTETR